MRAFAGVLACLGIGLAALARPALPQGAPWQSRDYVALYFQHHNGQVPLPHLRDGKQRTLFYHLVDPRNITRIQEAGIPRQAKVRELRLMLATLGGFRASYNLAIVIGEPLQQELALVQAYSLAVAAVLSREVEDPQALADVSPAWATLLDGVIASVGDGSRYSPAQRTLLADAVARHYPSISRTLRTADRQRLLAAAERLQLAGASANQEQAIMNMQRALREAVAATPPLP
jgi:hypothetical protein